MLPALCRLSVNLTVACAVFVRVDVSSGVHRELAKRGPVQQLADNTVRLRLDLMPSAGGVERRQQQDCGRGTHTILCAVALAEDLGRARKSLRCGQESPVLCFIHFISFIHSFLSI
jgi:hypothetical protein